LKSVYTDRGELRPGPNGAFKARMQAQCREIEAYRRAVEREEHRTLTPDQAASEWIEKYAESFSTPVKLQPDSIGC